MPRAVGAPLALSFMERYSLPIVPGGTNVCCERPVSPLVQFEATSQSFRSSAHCSDEAMSGVVAMVDA